MTRLLLDAMCGGIRAQLRMCGHDAAFALDRGIEDAEALQEIAVEEDRQIVTRNRRLAEQAEDAILLTTRDPGAQLAELSDAGIELSLPETPERCGRCNGRLAGVDPEADTPGYAPAPNEEAVWRCVDCGQYFWRGSHWDRVGDSLPE